MCTFLICSVMCIVKVVSGPAEFGRPGSCLVAELFRCKLALPLVYENTARSWLHMIAGWETITNWKAETIVESSVGVIKPFLIAENTSIPPSIASGSLPTSLLMQYSNHFTGPVDVVCASCLWCSPKKKCGCVASNSYVWSLVSLLHRLVRLCNCFMFYNANSGW